MAGLAAGQTPWQPRRPRQAPNPSPDTGAERNGTDPAAATGASAAKAPGLGSITVMALNGPATLGGCHVIAAYILIQTEPGKAATVAAALRDLPGVSQAASVAGPYDIIARAEARDIDELGKLVATRVWPLDGVTRTLSCPVLRL